MIEPKKQIPRVFLLIVIGVCVGANVFSNVSTDSTVKDSIEQIVNAEAKYDLFSGAILVTEKGEIIYSGAFGLEDKANNIQNKLTTKFSLGSIGKTFTAVLIMQLVERGQMELSDTLEQYLPDFPYPEKSRILISHLLTHSSGLGNYFTHKDYESKMQTLRHIRDALPLVYDQKLLFQPGEKYEYSNSGMLVLGAILEKVSGMSYREYLKKEILIPAGMSDSGISYPEESVADRAIGYSKIDENKYKVETEREFPAFSDGGLYSTVGDMLKYDRALYENKLLSQKTKEIMFSMTGPNKNYALGWETGVFMGEKFVGHVGGCYGFAADFIRFPEKQRMIIVLSNYTETGLELAAKIKHLVFTGGKSNIPLATQYDYNFRKGRDLGEFRKQYKEAVEYLDKNIQGDDPHLPSLFSAARARIFGNFEVEQALKLLGALVNSDKMEIHPSVTRNSTLYFCSARSGGLGGDDIYRSRCINGKYTEPENLGDMINTKYGEGDIFIAPDESYIIFSSGRPGGFGRGDLYISYSRQDGTWTKSINMSKNINSPFLEYCPYVSPDGKYLFFTSYRKPGKNYISNPLTYDEIKKTYQSPQNGLGDIYWVDAKIIEELQQKE